MLRLKHQQNQLYQSSVPNVHVCLRYPRLQSYKEYETIIIVIIWASTLQDDRYA